jgi:putative endonuclease
MSEHRNKIAPGFTSKYNVNKLVWYKVLSNSYDAIAAEKKIKGWRREKEAGIDTCGKPEV